MPSYCLILSHHFVLSHCLMITNALYIDKQVAERSLLIKNMLEDLGESALSETIPIPNVSCCPTYCLISA